MEIGLITTAIVVFFSYVAYVWIGYGVQRSISNSYYKLPKNRKFLFILFCWLFAFPVMILGDSALMFAAGTFICFVGAAAAFKGDKMTKWVHMVGAYGGVALAMTSIWIDHDKWYLVVLFAAISALLMVFKKILNYNQIWWIEILAFSLVLITLM